MKCDEARALSTPALDNELTVEQAALFNSHIDQCARCSSSWDSALHIRTGVKEVVRSFPSTTDLESKIKRNLDRAESESSRIWKNQWLLAAACVLPVVLVVAVLTIQGVNKTVSIAEVPAHSTASNSLSVDQLISKTSHSDDTSQDDDSFSSRSIDLAQKAEIGFPLIEAKLVAYELGGAEVLQTDDKKIVRMCFKTNGSDVCIDCYEAPAGVIKFNPNADRLAFGDKQLSTARVGNVNLVMFSRQGIDVVYASALPQGQLLKLVQPNV